MLSGKKLSDLRKGKGISQELLAENSRISLRTIQRIETGSVQPRLHTIKTIADALGVPIGDLSSDPILNSSDADVDKLRMINFSSLAGLVIPLSNIVLPLLVWRKHRHLHGVGNAGKKIIHFQLAWTIVTVCLLFLLPFIQHALVGSYVIGRFPPTIVLVYFTMLAVNLALTVRTARQIQDGHQHIYSFVPELF